MQDIISTLKNALQQAEAGLEVAVGRLAKDGTERGDLKPSEVLALASVRAALAMPVTCLHQIQEPAPSMSMYASKADCEAAIKAAPAAVAVPDGWKLVPLRATKEMLLAAGFSATAHGQSTTGNERWEAFLTSAPMPPSQARAALAATPAAVEVPAEGDPESLLQLATLIESGRGLIHVERKEIANALRALAATPAATAPVMPADWVPCAVTHEGQHPEEVAYGPQIMMDRLKKWLERYFELKAAAPVVLPEPVATLHCNDECYVWARASEVGKRMRFESPIALYTEQQVRALLAGVSAPAQAEHQPWLLYLSDRADGVAGRYAIARWNPAGYREVWNLRSHRWSSFSDEVLTLEQAQELLKQVAIPTAPQAQAQADDSDLLDAMERQRIAVVPEYEGPWDAEVYNDDGEPIHAGSGTTPREAIRAAIAAAKGKAQ